MTLQKASPGDGEHDFFDMAHPAKRDNPAGRFGLCGLAGEEGHVPSLVGGGELQEVAKDVSWSPKLLPWL